MPLALLVALLLVAEVASLCPPAPLVLLDPDAALADALLELAPVPLSDEQLTIPAKPATSSKE